MSHACSRGLEAIPETSPVIPIEKLRLCPYHRKYTIPFPVSDFYNFSQLLPIMSDILASSILHPFSSDSCVSTFPSSSKSPSSDLSVSVLSFHGPKLHSCAFSFLLKNTFSTIPQVKLPNEVLWFTWHRWTGRPYIKYVNNSEYWKLSHQPQREYTTLVTSLCVRVTSGYTLLEECCSKGKWASE